MRNVDCASIQNVVTVIQRVTVLGFVPEDYTSNVEYCGLELFLKYEVTQVNTGYFT
jgi:hypothetical protein